jgi:hypothetical protein
MTKHEQYYQEMIDNHSELFFQFQDLHDQYVLQPEKLQKEFNEVGVKVMDVIREWERKLCQHSERGKFGKYSDKLADKFWNLVRKDYPKIDFVGVSY